jgi:hypothetical protein
VNSREWLGWLVRSIVPIRGKTAGALSIVLIASGAVAGCRHPPITDFSRLVEARQLASDLLVEFTKSVDAGNRAVMADTDETSIAFAHEAQQAAEAVSKDIDSLATILRELEYSNESGMLAEFSTQFGDYRKLDQSILELAVENTNLKAQRLSFGPAQEAADALRDALEGAAAKAPAKNALRVQALVAQAVAAVREMQVLQAPHIAESDEAAMTRLEQKAKEEESAARHALDALAPLVQLMAKPQLDASKAALDRFVDLNGQIVALSRRNSNVRSLALSLGQKRMLTATCEDSLRALQDALAKRGFTGTR